MKKLIIGLAMLLFVGCGDGISREDRIISTYEYAGDYIYFYANKVELNSLYYKDSDFESIYVKTIPMSECSKYTNKTEAKIRFINNKNK